MKSNPRWLQATIEFSKKNPNAMPWSLKGSRRDWSKRCSERANSDHPS